MYTFGAESVIAGDVSSIWRTWTDLESYPSWDPREQETRLDGPFSPGATGWSSQKGNPGGPFTVTAVEPQRRWSTRSPLPGGSLVIDHWVAQDGTARVRVGKRYEVHGPLAILFRLYYGPRVARALSGTFSALEGEARRRG